MRAKKAAPSCDLVSEPKERGWTYDEEDPEEPTPALVLRDVAHRHVSKGRSVRRGESVDRDRISTLVSSEEIMDHTSRIGERGRSCESRDEATDENGLDVGCEGLG